jgi:lysophospholipase L1-like esterase
MAARLTRTVAVAMLALLAAPAAFTSAARAEASKATYYLSVGDSLAQGFQPIGGPHTNSPASGYAQGYAEHLWKLARRQFTQLRLEKLGCGVESTATMVANSRCAYPEGSQLDAAIAFLDAHRGDVAFITVTLGANDLFVDCNGSTACAAQQVGVNLPLILRTLRAHAPGVPIVGMNYYRPLVVAWFDDPAAGQAAAAATVAFNNFLESIYAAFGVVASRTRPFSTGSDRSR